MKIDRRPRDDASTPYQVEFEVFFRSNYEAISRYAARRVPASSHDAVVAATFVVAWRKFATVASPSLAWLYRIACYEVAHERRGLGRRSHDVELNDLDLADNAPLQEVFDLSQAFGQLSETDAEILRLVYWETLSRNEIAEVLGLSVNVVNVRYHRALDRLTGALNRLAIVARTDESTPELPKENQ